MTTSRDTVHRPGARSRSFAHPALSLTPAELAGAVAGGPGQVRSPSRRAAKHPGRTSWPAPRIETTVDFPAVYEAAADGLLLRPYRVADVPSLVTNARDPSTRAFMASSPADPSTGGMLEWVRDNGSRPPAEPGRAGYAVADPATDELLAGAVVHRHRHRDSAELGFWVCADVRDRGVGTRVVRALGELCFARGIHRVELVIRTGDGPSRHLAEATGFRRGARLREVPPRPGAGFGTDPGRPDGELWVRVRPGA
ncbi:GNAT family N-acetyltransferase [Amycolatopsis sp. PS_44_ISF1]|uniref:GNAT family N-acetyltransferase n=1 Tax=Amycolatopsis sp. PS_44_ISF1 TaxID=2974917 RepID=UPI0028DEF4B1|nr:GNAT family N-acetyltransferase [Amycolatopsis sp. PS_44_ISF1]MDT8911948.1 GNAT family N-acetyltransferase [Amycolatopsis sp. PS_44_ISF1]